MSALIGPVISLIATSELQRNHLEFLKSTEAATSFSLINSTVLAGQKITLLDFHVENNSNLATFTLTGTVGLHCEDNTPSTHFPIAWSKLTKLTNISFSGCAFSEEQIEDYVRSFIVAVQAGLGSAVATGKVINFTGVNGKFNTSVVGGQNQIYLTTLASLGWTLQTNP